MGKIKGVLTTSDYLPMEEFIKLINGLRIDNMYVWELYCCLSFCTAHRVSDVLTYKWKDVLGKTDITKIERKTGKTRTIQFNEDVRKKINELYHLLDKPDIDQFMICNPKTKEPYTLRHINRVLKTFRVKYRLPIKAFSTHTFRKTFGRHVYEHGGRTAESLILLSSIFKHSSIDMTKIYIGLQQTEINNVFNSIKF